MTSKDKFAMAPRLKIHFMVGVQSFLLSAQSAQFTQAMLSVLRLRYSNRAVNYSNKAHRAFKEALYENLRSK